MKNTDTNFLINLMVFFLLLYMTKKIQILLHAEIDLELNRYIVLKIANILFFQQKLDQLI